MQKYEDQLFVVQKETDSGVVWFCYSDTPQDIKDELKGIDDLYYKNYGAHIIEFE